MPVIIRPPLYISKRSLKSFGNEYRIYGDRVELEVRFLFSTITIPLEEILSIELYPPPVFLTRLWALKLDCADMYPHLGIERKKGFMKHLRFTPNNPEEFRAQVLQLTP